MTGYETFIQLLKSKKIKYTPHSLGSEFSIDGDKFIVRNFDSPMVQIIIIIDVSQHSKSTIMETCNFMNDNAFLAKFMYVEQAHTVYARIDIYPTPNFISDDYFAPMALLNRACTVFKQKL